MTKYRIESFKLKKRKKISFFFDRKKYEQAWDKHDKEVREHCKNRPNDFLILDILGGSDKPKKLYDFLEHDNPPEEFGHWNKKNN